MACWQAFQLNSKLARTLEGSEGFFYINFFNVLLTGGRSMDGLLDEACWKAVFT